MKIFFSGGSTSPPVVIPRKLIFIRVMLQGRSAYRCTTINVARDLPRFSAQLSLAHVFDFL